MNKSLKYKNDKNGIGRIMLQVVRRFVGAGILY